METHRKRILVRDDLGLEEEREDEGEREAEDPGDRLHHRHPPA